jgi:phosphonate transport system ATP-binding protein
MNDLPPYERPINMMFQSYALFPHMTVEQNIAFGLKQDGLSKDAIKKRVDEMLALVQLGKLAKRKPHQLSGGQQQRVAIARVLAQEAKIILADEPVASLDPLTTKQVMDDLKKINLELGITTIVNLHYIDLAREYATRIIGLRSGVVVFDGPVSEATDERFAEIYGRPIKSDELLGEPDL